MEPRVRRNSLVLATAAGSFISFLGFAFMLAAGRMSWLIKEPFGNFYDAQARALLHGHWNVSPAELAFEGFRIHGKTYTYFGTWPSVLRMPFLELAPSSYGRMTQLSMLLAFAVFLLGLGMLQARIREVLRPCSPLGRSDLSVAFLAPIVIGLGSSALFQASRAWVYHEAILWGIAWSVIAFERIIAFQASPSTGSLVGASGATTLAFSSRASVGSGALVALALVLIGHIIRRWTRQAEATPAGAIGSEPVATPEVPRGRRARRTTLTLRTLARLDWLGPSAADEGAPTGRIARLVGAVTVPAAAYAYANWSRFGSLFNVPWRRQLLFDLDPMSRRTLDANGGGYFSLKYIPTALYAYIRPGAISPNAVFPWLTFPRTRPPIIGPIVFAVDLTSSVSASMPGIALLGIIGALAACSLRVARTRRASVLRVPLIGGAVGVGLVLSLAVVSERYLGDWVPLLTVASLGGIHILLLRRSQLGPTDSKRGSTALLTVVAILAVAGVWANGSLALMYQRLYAPQQDSLRAGTIETQYDIARALGQGALQAVTVDQLPSTPAMAGTSVVVGDCQALYWSDGDRWRLVQGSPAGGVARLRVEFPPTPGPTWYPLTSWTTPTGPQVIAVRRDPNSVKFSRSARLADGSLTFTDVAPAFPVGAARLRTVQIALSRPLQLLTVTIEGATPLVLAGLKDLPTTAPQVGTSTAAGVAPSYPATLRELPPELDACRSVQRAAR